MAPLSQVEASQYMYGARAGKYENSWHPHYSARFVHIVNAQPGQRILDLCCGTGLDLFMLAEALNKSDNADDGGVVVGVDTTVEMLAVASLRRQARPDLARRTQLLRHDVTHLETLATSGEAGGEHGAQSVAVTEQSFDAIVCSSAFVLFDDPDAAVASWRRYLKAPSCAPVTDDGHDGHRHHHCDQGGALVVDIPHEASQRSGLTMERVARRLGLVFPSNRSWVRSIDSFRDVLERNGYKVERIVELDRISGQGTLHYAAEQVDALYDSLTKSEAFEAMAAGAGPGVDMVDIVKRGQPIFREEFMRDAGEDGRVAVSDTIYVYVARLAG